MHRSDDTSLYQADEGDVSVEAYIKDETIWISQKSMAELFGVGTAAVNKHLTNIYADGELVEAATVSKMETVQQEGSRSVKREMKFYNLNAIIFRLGLYFGHQSASINMKGGRCKWIMSRRRTEPRKSDWFK